MIDTKNLIVQHKGNNAFVIDTKNKNIHVLIWNAIEKKFNNIPLKYDVLKNIIDEEGISTKSVEIEMNTVVYSQSYQHGHIIDLFRKYDQESNKPYDHTTIKNRALNGLTQPRETRPDDYLFMLDDIAWIEENPNEWNTSYTQDMIWLPNKFLGNIAPGACWRLP